MMTTVNPCCYITGEPGVVSVDCNRVALKRFPKTLLYSPIAMQSGSAEQVIQYMNNVSTHFSIMLDNRIADVYGVKAFPTSLVKILTGTDCLLRPQINPS